MVHSTTAGAPTLAAARWALATSWTHPDGPLLHARAETATTKPTFRDAVCRRRAIVPCEGWTEWRTTGGPRERYWTRRTGANPRRQEARLAGLAAQGRRVLGRRETSGERR